MAQISGGAGLNSERRVDDNSDSRSSSVRWVILVLLTVISFVSYLERSNISVAATQMMPALGLDKVQMGQVFSVFLLGYAIFQIPGGFLGDKIGPRIILGVAALGWGLTTVLTGFLPGLLVRGTAATLWTLLILRFIFGLTESPTYPVASLTIRNWIPQKQRGFANAVMLCGTPGALAVAVPLVSWLMVRFGWRASFYITSAIAFVIAIAWLIYGADSPEKHRSVNRAELELISSDREKVQGAARWTTKMRRAHDKKFVLLLVSYFCEGYVLFIFVFWLFIYLTEVRKFTALSGSLWASLPWIVSIPMMPLAGYISDRLSTRGGALAGPRTVIMASYSLCGIMLFCAIAAHNRYLAVAILSLSIGFMEGAEASFWATVNHLAKDAAGTAGGIMNTVGVLGGVVSTALVPILEKHFGWIVALGSGAAMAVLCAVLWIAMPRDDAPITT